MYIRMLIIVFDDVLEKYGFIIAFYLIALGLCFYLYLQLIHLPSIQNPRPTSESTEPIVEGFSSFSWGTSRRTVKSRYGSPDRSKPVRENRNDSGTVYTYSERKLFGLKGNLMFFFDPGDQLVRGIFKVPIDDPESCLEEYDKISRKVSRKYRALEGRKRVNKEVHVPFCNALQVHKARAIAHWRDPFSGTNLVLSLGQKSKNEVILVVESLQYYQTLNST